MPFLAAVAFLVFILGGYALATEGFDRLLYGPKLDEYGYEQFRAACNRNGYGSRSIRVKGTNRRLVYGYCTERDGPRDQNGFLPTVKINTKRDCHRRGEEIFTIVWPSQSFERCMPTANYEKGLIEVREGSKLIRGRIPKEPRRRRSG